MTTRGVALLLLALGGCGLLGSSQAIGFRTYPLPEVPYAEAESLVPDVVRTYYADHFSGTGGFSIDWNGETGHLRASPVVAGERRLRFYAVISPAGTGTRLELFALVETLDDASSLGEHWGRPMQDVPLEQRLYEAILAEHLRRGDR